MDDDEKPPVGTDAHLTGGRSGPFRRMPRPARALVYVVLVVAVLLLLFLVVFPWFEEYTDDPTLDATVRAAVSRAGG